MKRTSPTVFNDRNDESKEDTDDSLSSSSYSSEETSSASSETSSSSGTTASSGDKMVVIFFEEGDEIKYMDRYIIAFGKSWTDAVEKLKVWLVDKAERADMVVTFDPTKPSFPLAEHIQLAYRVEDDTDPHERVYENLFLESSLGSYFRTYDECSQWFIFEEDTFGPLLKGTFLELLDSVFASYQIVPKGACPGCLKSFVNVGSCVGCDWCDEPHCTETCPGTCPGELEEEKRQLIEETERKRAKERRRARKASEKKERERKRARKAQKKKNGEILRSSR